MRIVTTRLTVPMGKLRFLIWKSWIFFFSFRSLWSWSSFIAICSRNTEVIKCWKSRFLWKKLMEGEEKTPFNSLGLDNLAHQMVSDSLFHRERNPSLSLDHWFCCSLSQLRSYNRPQGTPGVFHWGNLEVEGRTHRGSVFKNISTQGCCSSVENLRQCVSKVSEKTPHYLL